MTKRHGLMGLARRIRARLTGTSRPATPNRDWFARTVAVVTLAITLSNFVAQRNAAAEHVRDTVNSLLDQALDDLGGYEGTNAIQLQTGSLTNEQLEKARRKIDRALERNPQNPRAVRMKGTYLALSGDLPGARAEYEKAIRIDRWNPRSWNNLGVVLRRLGQPKDALRAFQRAIELDSQNPAIYVNCGGAHEALGEIQEAMEAYKTALKLKALRTGGSGGGGGELMDDPVSPGKKPNPS